MFSEETYVIVNDKVRLAVCLDCPLELSSDYMGFPSL